MRRPLQTCWCCGAELGTRLPGECPTCNSAADSTWVLKRVLRHKLRRAVVWLRVIFGDPFE